MSIQRRRYTGKLSPKKSKNFVSCQSENYCELGQEEESFWTAQITDINKPNFVLDINIFGTIADLSAPETISFLNFLHSIRDNMDEIDGIYLNISSYGGSLDTCIAIYNLLRAFNVPIFTIGNSVVFSAGALLFMLGDKRITYPNTHYLFHSGKLDGYMNNENIYNFKTYIEIMNKKSKNIQLEILSEYLSNDILDKIESGIDVYFSDEEMINLGLADCYVYQLSDEEKEEKCCSQCEK